MKTAPGQITPKTPSLADQPLAVQEPSVGQMLQKVIDSGITPETVNALEKLCDLKIKVDAINAEKEFASAFNRLMAEIPQIKATKSVPNNDGSTRYKFAPIEEIDRQLRPLALEHGFTYYFAEGDSDAGKVEKLCVVQHVGGHKRSNPFSVRVSKPPGSSDSQADGSTHSYAKRGALCDAFGIIIEHMDDDARLLGKPIGKALAEDLEARCEKLGVDKETFLKYAGAANFESIADNRYDSLNEQLEKKERGAAKKKGDESGPERSW